jgi:hypothetical protein
VKSFFLQTYSQVNIINMSDYSKIGTARPPFPKAHPFKIDLGKLKSSPGSPPKFTLSVNYHSGLFDGFQREGDFVNFKRVSITGLDFPEQVPGSFPGKNFYCVLKITFVNGLISKSEIVWIESDESQEDLDPIKITTSDNGLSSQSEARVIIGVLINDDEVIAGLPGGGSAVNTPYILQYINTNLVITDFCVNGLSVKYPIPMSGGRLNF